MTFTLVAGYTNHWPTEKPLYSVCILVQDTQMMQMMQMITQCESNKVCTVARTHCKQGSLSNR